MSYQVKTVKIAVSKMGKALGEILRYQNGSRDIKRYIDEKDKKDDVVKHDVRVDKLATFKAKHTNFVRL